MMRERREMIATAGGFMTPLLNNRNQARGLNFMREQFIWIIWKFANFAGEAEFRFVMFGVSRVKMICQSKICTTTRRFTFLFARRFHRRRSHVELLKRSLTDWQLGFLYVPQYFPLNCYEISAKKKFSWVILVFYWILDLKRRSGDSLVEDLSFYWDFCN